MTACKLGPLLHLASADGARQAGGKGAALAELARAGLPVPPSWILPARVLDEAVARMGLADLVQQVGQELKRDGQSRAAYRLRSAMLGMPIAAEVSHAVVQLLEALRADDDQAALAIRSSATGEGVRGASFAGQFQTFLHLRHSAAAEAAIRSCWASLWSAGALSYRTRSAAVEAPGMAVLLQLFIPAVAAGAARVDGDCVEIEAAGGLGATVMSGLVVPDRWWFGLDGRLHRAEPGRKPVQAAACDGGLIWEPVPSERRQALSLDAATAAEVARLAVEAAAVLGKPLEVEWALAERGPVLWIVQGRRSERAPERANGSSEPARGDLLPGIPVAPGVVVGRIRLVERPADLIDIGPGDVVVARYAAAELMRHLAGAGLVTEMGGASTHAATLARERRVPMVAGVLGATRWLSEGALVRLDGGTGTVELLGRNPGRAAALASPPPGCPRGRQRRRRTPGAVVTDS